MPLPNRSRLPEPPPSPLERSDRGRLAASERWLGGRCAARAEGVGRCQELRSDRWASLSWCGERGSGWLLGPSRAGHASCSRKGLARSTRIRAGSSPGTAQEFRMKAMIRSSHCLAKSVSRITSIAEPTPEISNCWPPAILPECQEDVWRPGAKDLISLWPPSLPITGFRGSCVRAARSHHVLTGKSREPYNPAPAGDVAQSVRAKDS